MADTPKTMTDAEFMLAEIDKEKAGFYFCNKCGYTDSEGPDHDKPKSYPKFQCPYRAVLVQHNKGYIAKLDALGLLAILNCQCISITAMHYESGIRKDVQEQKTECKRCEALRKFRAAMEGK